MTETGGARTGLPPAWEKAKVTATIVSAIVIPLVVGVIGHRYTSALKEREVQAEFVSLAVSILQETPDQQSQSLRKWAVTVVNRYSGVAMPDDVRTQLIERKALPERLPSFQEARRLR